MSHPNVAKELFIRKRNLEKERNISPVAFDKNVRSSNRIDDKLTTPTLNRLNHRQIATMLKKRTDPIKATEHQREITLMNEDQTIDVIEEEKFRRQPSP